MNTFQILKDKVANGEIVSHKSVPAEAAEAVEKEPTPFTEFFTKTELPTPMTSEEKEAEKTAIVEALQEIRELRK